MLDVNKVSGEIYITRGDNGEFSLCLEVGNNMDSVEHTLKEGDNLYLGIEEPNQPFENAVVKKVINLSNSLLDKNKNLIVTLEPDDTICLMPGTYFYEIKGKFYKGNVYRNRYTYLVLREDGVFLVYNNEDEEEIVLTGTYTQSGNIITLYTTGLENITATVQGNFITINDGTSGKYNLTYKQEKDLIETVIPKSRFTIGE